MEMSYLEGYGEYEGLFWEDVTYGRQNKEW